MSAQQLEYPFLLTFNRTFRDRQTLQNVTRPDGMAFSTRDQAERWLDSVRRNIKNGKLQFTLSDAVITERK